ncbi:hypothetical protein GLOIN_2v1766632 [Rhizophagus clarus]|uniref:Uncharacterized protein n=1 Tax=Rhizophagus clarus TaxID=94130 RepID=A0A8H3M8V2_9GLOM|nr:hypothetical protein GLOIN_2v1766632 [Rhizophagus clarus]
MPRPPKPIKRSILENRKAKFTQNERDLENTKFKTSEATSKNEKLDDEPVFNLVLTPDILRDLENPSEKISLERKPVLSTKFNSVKSSPAIEISSSSGEEELFYHLSSSREVRCSFPTKALSSSEDNKKSLLGVNSSLANTNELSKRRNLSTPKRHKSKMFLIEQKPKKEVEMNSEDSESDPFGFRKAEKRNMKRKGQSKFSDDSEKFDVTTISTYSNYNDNVQSEMTSRSISLNKENDIKGSGDLCEIGKEDWIQRSQESKDYNASIEDRNDDNQVDDRKDDDQVDNDNSQPIHDDHLSTEIDKESLEVTPIKTPRDKNKKEEKKTPNAMSSKVRKTSNITKTADLVSLLPPRRRQLKRASKDKVDKYSDTQSDYEGEVTSLGEDASSNYKKKTQKRKLQKLGKIANEKSEKRKTRKIKKEPLTCESRELDEKIKQERTKRTRHTEEIDKFVLVEEAVR